MRFLKQQIFLPLSMRFFLRVWIGVPQLTLFVKSNSVQQLSDLPSCSPVTNISSFSPRTVKRMRPLFSVWSCPQRLGTLFSQRLCTFMSQPHTQIKEREAFRSTFSLLPVQERLMWRVRAPRCSLWHSRLKQHAVSHHSLLYYFLGVQHIMQITLDDMVVMTWIKAELKGINSVRDIH